MMNLRTFARCFSVAVATAALLGATPPPSPAPAATRTPVTLTNFASTGTLSGQATITDKTVGFEADLAVWRRSNRLRIDLRKLAASSQDPTSNALLSQLVPAGGITVLFDQRSSTITLWSSATHTYYRTKTTFTMPKTKPTPKPKPSAKPKARGSVLDMIMKAAQSMTEYDVYSQTFELSGHQPVNGHMASVFHFTSHTQKHGDNLQQIDGTLALADDLSGIPLQFVVTAMGKMTGNLRADLLTVTTTAPDAQLFALPNGYKPVKSPLEVLHNPAHRLESGGKV